MDTSEDAHEGRSAFGAAHSNVAMKIIGAEDEYFENDIDPTVDDQYSAFNSIELVKKRPAHLMVFLQHVMLQFDCSPVLCYLHADLCKSLSPKEMKKHFVELCNTYLDKVAVLKIQIPVQIAYELDRTRPDMIPEETQKRFAQDLQNSLACEVVRQLEDFRHKRMMGMTANERELSDVEAFPTQDRIALEIKERNVAEQLLDKLADIHPTICPDEERCTAMFTAVVSYMKHLGVRTKSSDSKKSRLFFKKKPKKPDEPSSKHKILSNLLRETSSWIGGGNVESRPSKTDSEGDKTSHKSNGRPSADPPTSSTRKPGSCSLTVVPDTSEGSQVTISVTNSPDSTHSDTAASSGRSDSQSLSDSADQSPGARGGSCAPDAPPPCDTPSEESAETEKVGGIKLGRSESLCVERRRSHRGSSRAKQNRSRSDVDLQTAGTATGPPSPATSHPPNHRHAASSDSVAVQADQPQPGPVSAPAEECEPRTAELEQDPPNWRECIPPETSRTLNKRETKRQEVINELFLTEHAHVRMLTVLQNVFARPMERESIMTSTELEAIFPNLEEIIEMHYSFYESLKRLRQESSFIVKAIGQTLLSRFSGAEGEWFQKLSARFCSHQSYALDFIKGRQKKDPKFNTFIQEAESKPQCRRLQLKDIIPIEMQRLTKYPLLLENIAKSTDDEAEKNRIQQAADCCKKILNHVNDEVKNMENLLSLKDYQRRLDVSGLKPSNELMAEFKNLDLTQRRMIFEGPLTWRVTKEKAIDVQALLLTDILVLLQKQDDKMVLKCQSKSTTGVQEGKQMLSPIIKLGSVFLRDVATDRKAFYVIFTWDSGAQIYELVAQTVSEMKNWTELITSAAADQKQAAVAAPVERKRFGSYVPPGNIPQSPTLPTDNGAISLKDAHLSSTDRDKDSLLDGRGGASWASLLAANGIDPITLGQASEEKLANGALDEVHSLKRMLVRSISLSEEPQSEISPVSENPPSLGPEGEEPSDQSGGAGDERRDTDSRQSPGVFLVTEQTHCIKVSVAQPGSDSSCLCSEEGAAAEGRAERAGEDDSGPGQEECGISAPLLLSHDQVTTVERSLKLLEEKLRQLQGLEEEYHKLHKCLSKAFFSQQSLS
ncbi:rho guanine nucleotide exchange factor 1 isoform X2 [Lepisosteus oculatus]|uniref:rho guanine nucleotide exchange factor 1 isoform X2 n=1 Tax=Lepisosteus oculatus TaxID=7918 RepID=UPI00371A92C9